MTRIATFIAARDRRRAGIAFRKGQPKPVELPEDENEAKALFETLQADPVLKLVENDGGLDQVEEDPDTATQGAATPPASVKPPVKKSAKPAVKKAAPAKQPTKSAE
ncbi:hypothetical protein [Roseibium sp.]|uniref:hypothetical protein n=1 Tax=Roseibium sp. TaxID=1936156 RepID=UPI003D0D6A31